MYAGSLHQVTTPAAYLGGPVQSYQLIYQIAAVQIARGLAGNDVILHRWVKDKGGRMIQPVQIRQRLVFLKDDVHFYWLRILFIFKY
jgi:hypothetical protein